MKNKFWLRTAIVVICVLSVICFSTACGGDEDIDDSKESVSDTNDGSENASGDSDDENGGNTSGGNTSGGNTSGGDGTTTDDKGQDVSKETSIGSDLVLPPIVS